MNRDKVNVTRPSMPEFDEYIEEIKSFGTAVDYELTV